MVNRCTIGTYTTAPAGAGNTDESLTPTSCLNSMEANLNYLINGAPLEATGVLGFTELLTELEQAEALQGSHRTQALQDISQRTGHSTVKLCHIISVMRESRMGGAA